jgi:DNA-binding MarR family transcriptional regulator
MRRSTLQAEIRKRRPFDLPQEEAFLNLQRCAAVLAAQAERLLKSHGLSGSQYNALRILRGAKAGGDWALPCLEVAQRMITAVPDITRLIDRLESAGLVQRHRTKDDRRVVLVSITKSGLDALADVDRPLADLHRAQMGHLSRSELSMLNRLLVKSRHAENLTSQTMQSP